MNIISVEEFFEVTWKNGWAPKSRTKKLLVGRGFDCVCGESHVVTEGSVAREMPKVHYVLECPDGKGMVCVKIKGLFSPALISQFGAITGE